MHDYIYKVVCFFHLFICLFLELRYGYVTLAGPKLLILLINLPIVGIISNASPTQMAYVNVFNNLCVKSYCITIILSLWSFIIFLLYFLESVVEYHIFFNFILIIT
jgi:hypothetical protein